MLKSHYWSSQMGDYYLLFWYCFHGNCFHNNELLCMQGSEWGISSCSWAYKKRFLIQSLENEWRWVTISLLSPFMYISNRHAMQHNHPVIVNLIHFVFNVTQTNPCYPNNTCHTTAPRLNIFYMWTTVTWWLTFCGRANLHHKSNMHVMHARN